MFASHQSQQIPQILAVENRLASGEFSHGLTSLKTLIRWISRAGGKASCSGSTAALPVSAAIALIETRKKRANRPQKQAIAAGWRFPIQLVRVVIIDGGTTRRNGPLPAG